MESKTEFIIEVGVKFDKGMKYYLSDDARLVERVFKTLYNALYACCEAAGQTVEYVVDEDGTFYVVPVGQFEWFRPVERLA